MMSEFAIYNFVGRRMRVYIATKSEKGIQRYKSNPYTIFREFSQGKGYR